MKVNNTHVKCQKSMRKNSKHNAIGRNHNHTLDPVSLSLAEEAEASYYDTKNTKEMELDFLDNNRKADQSLLRIGKIAAVLLLIFITSSGMALFLNSDASYSIKGTIQNVKHFFAPEKEPTMDNAGLEELKITNWQNVKNGRDMVERLFVPQYIPEGYMFDSVCFSNIDSMSTTLYTYVKEQVELLVFVETLTEEGDVYVEGSAYIDSKTGQKLYVLDDKETGICTSKYLDGENFFRVSGTLTKEESAKIIAGLKEIK